VCAFSPTLDVQQLATHARDASLMTANDVAVSVLAEVASGMPPISLPGKTNKTDA
jgi:D-serine ammonia-lyase